MRLSFLKEKFDYLFVVLSFILGFLGNGFIEEKYFIPFSFLPILFLFLKRDEGIDFYVSFYLVLCMFSFLFSPYNRSFYGFYVEGICLIYFLCGIYFSSREEMVKFLEKAFVLAGVLVLIENIVYTIYGKQFLFTSRNQNYQSFFYSVIFAFLAQKGRFSLGYIIFSLALWIVCAVINSRTGLLTFSVLTVFRLYQRIDKWSIYLLCIFVIFLIVIILNPWHFLKLYDPNSYIRLDMYLVALKSFLSRPFYGWGVGVFEFAYEIFKFPHFDGICFFNHSSQHAHSHFLNIFAEIGLFAGIIFNIMIFYSLKGNMKLYMLAMLFFYLFDGIFYNPFIRMLFLMISGVSFGKSSALKVGRLKVLSFIFSFMGIVYIFSPPPKDIKVYYNAYEEILSSGIYRTAAIGEYSYIFNSKNAVLKYFSGIVFYDHDKEYAKKILGDVITIEPGFISARLSLAKIYLDENDIVKFRKEVSKIVKLSSKKCGNLNFYAYMICHYDKDMLLSLKKKADNY